MKKGMESMRAAATIEQLKCAAAEFSTTVQVFKAILVDCGATLDEARDAVQTALDNISKVLNDKVTHMDEMLEAGASEEEVVRYLQSKLGEED